ncbi:MAG: glycosyltransferase family 2 protein [Balneolales bacterium]
METDKPLVTIGLSTYNRADDYLKTALDCAVSQTWPNLEIIVSDNCSDDDTEHIVKSYADPRIIYIRQKENIGAGNNFNFCLGQASGAYFHLFHDDDMIDPDFIELCMKMVMRNGDTGIIRTGTRIIDAAGNIRSIKPNYMQGLSNTDFLIKWFDDKTSLYLCSTLYNTKVLRETGGFTSETFLLNDVAAMLKVADKAGRIDISYVKAGFRRHEENRGSANQVANWVRDSVYLIDIIKNMQLDKKNQVIKKARYFLSRKCYRYIKSISSPARQAAAYFNVYSKLGYRYSPVAYHYRLNIKPRMTMKYIKKHAGRLGIGPAKT